MPKRGQAPRPTEERFWEKVDKSGDCWIWLAGTTNCKTHPYGLFRTAGFGCMMKAHQYAYIRARGYIPRGMVILHECDQTLCVRPDHLRAGTQKENVHDCMTKGRWGIRVGNGRRGRFNAQAMKVVMWCLANGYTQQRVADAHGVSQPLISLLAKKERDS